MSRTNGKIIIGKSYIYDVDDDICRLAASIQLPSEKKELYFEVEKKYKKYLCNEVADPFVFSLIYYALIKGMDIVCEDPMSEQLYYQLVNYYLPVVTKAIIHFHIISIETKTIPYNANCMEKNAVGASVSGGVDSFYTILKHYKKELSSFNITHLLVANILGEYKDEKDIHSKFEIIKKRGKSIANELKLELVSVYTNVYEFKHYRMPNYHTFKTCSLVLALKKLFGVYYFASGYSIADLKIEAGDTAHYDLLNLQTISDKKLTFYSSGGEIPRTLKTEYIASNAIVQKYLQVCNINIDKNCSLCSKCNRTLSTLDVIGCLGKYDKIFDIGTYNSQRRKIWSDILSRKSEYDMENSHFAKERGFVFPKGTKILAWFKMPYYKMLEKINNVKVIRKVYYFLNIDVKRFGEEQAMFYRYEHRSYEENQQ